MQLSKEYRSVLKHFNTLNPNMYFRQGNIQSTMVGTKTGQPITVCRFTSNEIIPEDFAVMDLGTVLNIIDLFPSEFDVSIEKNKKLVISSNKKTINIVLTNPNFIMYVKHIDRLIAPEGESYSLSKESIDELLKIAAVFKTPHIFFEGKNGELIVGTEDCKNPTTNKSNYVVGSSQNTFKLVLDKENLKLFNGDYTFIPTNKFIYFVNSQNDMKIEYMIACNAEFSR